MLYRIWSNEHNAWWAPNSNGYTSVLEAAGWYDAEDTLNILTRSAMGSPPGRPKEEAIAVGGDVVFHVEIHTNDEEGGLT